MKDLPQKSNKKNPQVLNEKEQPIKAVGSYSKQSNGHDIFNTIDN